MLSHQSLRVFRSSSLRMPSVMASPKDLYHSSISGLSCSSSLVFNRARIRYSLISSAISSQLASISISVSKKLSYTLSKETCVRLS